nr:unnamed protein product [Digitaria exilis]
MAAGGHLRPASYLGDVSALSFLPSSPRPLLLAGTGSELLVYEVDAAGHVAAFQVFDGVRVHGIEPRGGSPKCSSYSLAVFGERRVKIFSLGFAVSADATQVGELRLELEQRLPGFDHWVLDARFLEVDGLLAIGLSDNSVALWDLKDRVLVSRVKSPEKCLLYSMRMWGDSVRELLVASGTILNEILIWKLAPKNRKSSLLCLNEGDTSDVNSREDNNLGAKEYMAVQLGRLKEHEGSIFRIAWSSDGSKFMSVSDDRSARMWILRFKPEGFVNQTASHENVEIIPKLTLFGHSARIWDCYVSDSILIAGDKKGNITAFPFPKILVLYDSGVTQQKVPPCDRFKGAHGISIVTSVHIKSSAFDHIEIHTTGGDGCICFFKYGRNVRKIEFFGMRQVKELGTIQSIYTNLAPESQLSTYAIGFTSADFIIWDLENETKMAQVSCGGWRRPYSYYLGPVPEYQNCFAFVKDHDIHIHRHWAPCQDKKVLPQVLHLQFHGREVHSLCFIDPASYSDLESSSDLLIATGCEDGTVRLTGLTVCFVVVACSDATLVLRALLLPSRLWFDVALLVPQTSPVLVLRHIIINGSHYKDDVGDRYLIVSGSTDGSITFWNLTETVHGFMQLISETQPHMTIDCQKRPRTGRGSQGGRRRWRSLVNHSLKKIDEDISLPDGRNLSTPYVAENSSETSGVENTQNVVHERSDRSNSEMPSSTQSCDIPELRPIQLLSGVHQSGVNCLHISYSTPDKSFCIISGGDDQAVQCFHFTVGSLGDCSTTTARLNSHDNGTLQILYQHKVPSAHSAAVKGIWTDGIWAFSTGLDQRVRCWKMGLSGKFTEYSHAITSVPEPETLDVFHDRAKMKYQIAVAGRGMQMVEFSPPEND